MKRRSICVCLYLSRKPMRIWLLSSKMLCDGAKFKLGRAWMSVQERIGSEGDAEPRFSRILRMIAQCKSSIHDLSRSTGEGGDNLARFNMPLELGMAAAFRFEREMSDRPPHRRFALVPEG